MPTLWTQTLIPTLRQAPAEAEAPSHQLMLRAGLIRKLGAGVYDYLPLGWRSLRKAMQIVRDEMDATGAAEVLLPALQPLDLWEKTGRREAYGDNLFVVKDRHGREQALGPTHEEVITELIGAYVESYRQLPITLYQIQTKFRDEFRPRFGVLRSREFQMKDAYSFHLTLESLDETYKKQFDAYCRIFERCGLPYEVVEAESGPIGGSASHEFMVPSPTGEDTILKSDKGNYAANVEKCEIGERYVPTFDYNVDRLKNVGWDKQQSFQPTAELETIHTPNVPGIEDVVNFFKKELKTKLKPQNMLKTLVCRFEFNGAASPDRVEFLNRIGVITADAMYVPYDIVVAVVRGDHELNLGKLQRAIAERRLIEVTSVELLDEQTANALGFAVGFVGPHVAQGMFEGLDVYVDPDAAQGGFWVTGANEMDHHVKHFNWKRDLIAPLHDRRPGSPMLVADIRNAVDGDPSPKNDGGVLHTTKGIEIGHVFKLGSKYSKALGVEVLDQENNRVPVIMGCYGIGINRLLASAIEREGGSDANGIIWPVSLAPYAVCITPIKYDGQAKQVADQLARELEAAGLDVLIDDRDERPGVKFKDADLIGLPVRITIGDKALATNQVEVKVRKADKPELVAISEAATFVRDALKTL